MCRDPERVREEKYAMDLDVEERHKLYLVRGELLSICVLWVRKDGDSVELKL